MRKYTADELNVTPDMAESEELTRELASALHGHHPLVQGAALADCVSMWLAGHHPSWREHVRRQWTQLVEGLVQINEKEMLDRYGLTDDWEEKGRKPNDR